MKPVTIIGMGMSLEDLTETHRERIRGADILMGGERHLAFFPDAAARKIAITRDIRGAIETIRACMHDRRVVVLASGDPLFYGIGSLIVGALAPEQVEVLPNISSVSAAFARMREPWSRAGVVSLHGRDRTGELLRLLDGHDRVAVFTDPVKNPAWLAAFLQAKGLDDVRVGVFERLGTPEERTGFYSLAAAAAGTFLEPNLVVLKRASRGESADGLHLGMDESEFGHEKGLITKTEVRAVTLAKLRLRPHHTLWDLGSGSGSVAIEASLLLRAGAVWAVERKPERVAQITANVRRFGVKNVEVVRAELPAGLEALPRPDRVFVGGGGRRLGAIVAAAASALEPAGVVVVNTVLLDNLHTATQTLETLGFDVEAVQVQVNRSRKMPFSQRFAAVNPVWIVTGAGKTGGE